MERKKLSGSPLMQRKAGCFYTTVSCSNFYRMLERFLFNIKALSIWRIQFAMMLLTKRPDGKTEFRNNLTGCFTE